MPTPLRVLMLEDSLDDADLMLLNIRREGFEPSCVRVENAQDLKAALLSDAWDVVLADYSLPGFSGVNALPIVREINPEIPFIIVSGTVGEEIVVEVMRAGANDYVLKHNLIRLGPAVAREIRAAADRRAQRFAELEAAKLAAIARSTDDAVIGEDLDGIIRSWNPAAERIYGWLAHEAIGQHLSMTVPVDKRDEFASIMQRIRRGESIDHKETVRLRRDGVRVDILLSVFPIRDAVGRVVGASKIVQDLTAKKKAREELDRAALILGNVRDAVITTDLNGVVTYWNEGATALFGWTSEEMLGKLVNATAPESRRAEQDAIVRNIAAGFEWDHEYEGIRKDGSRVWIDARVRLMRDDSGQPIGILGVSHDIKDRKRVEQQLQYSERFLRSGLDALSAHIAILDATGTILTVNEVWRQFGRENHLIRETADVGANYLTVCETALGTDVDYARAAAAGIRAVLSGDRATYHLAYPCNSPTEDRWFMMRVSRFDGGDGYRVVVAHENISEVKRSEELLRRQNEGLRLLSEAASQLLVAKDPTKMVAELFSTVYQHMGCDLFVHYGFDGVRLQLLASSGIDNEMLPSLAWLDLGQYVCGCCANAQRSISVSHVQQSDDWRVGAVKSLGVRAYVCHPLLAGERLLGTLSFGSRSKDVFGEHESEFLQTLAHYVATAKERLRAEAELCRTTDLLNAVANGTKDAVFVKDRQGRYLFCNPATAQFVGRSVEEVLGRDDRALFEADSAERVIAVDEHVMLTGQVDTVEERLTAGGVTRTYLAMKGPYRDGEGNIIGILGISHDITDRKQVEAERDELLARLQLQIERMPIAYILFDPDMQYTGWNPAAEKIFGYAREEILGKPMEMLIYDADQAQAHAIARRLRTGDVAANSVTRNVTKDGRVITCEWHNTPLFDSAGNFLGVLSMTLDVTDRVQAEMGLRESEERLRLALEAGRMGTYDWDISTGKIVWSDTHYEIFGYQAGNRFPVEFHHFADRLHPDDRDTINAAIHAAMEGKTSYSNEARILLPDGSIRWVLGTGEFHYDASGKPVRMLGTVADITDRKQAEAALRASEAQFRAFMDNGPFLAWITEVEGTIEYASGPFLYALALPHGGLVGSNLTDIFPPDIARKYLENNREVIRTGRVLTTTEPGVLADGTTGEFLVYKFPIPSVDRALVGGVAIDITERSHLQAELQMRDRAIQAVRQGIVITDPSHPDNPIVYVSPGFELLTGYTAAEVRGKNCRFLQGRDTDRSEIARLRQAIRNEEVYTGELLNYRKDGQPFWNELSITPVRDASKRLVHFVGIQSDVTTRRSLEDQLRQAQKMEAIGQLAGGVAHDFNNLLTVINGFSEVGLADTPPSHPLWEPLTAIRDAGERAAGLTQQLLAFSRKAIVAPRVLELNDVVGSIIKMLRRLIGEDIVLVTMLSANPCRVRIDPGQFEQVIMNLAVNARDAMPRGGRLIIEMSEIDLTISGPDYSPGRYVRVAVSDTGSGMSEEVKTRIFEPFFTTKGVGKGTGLGLAMVYGIVKQAGGHIRVDSVIGEGTTFSVLLPVVELDRSEVTKDGEVLLAPRGTETVLLAEDEDAVRKLARLALEMQGYVVLEARSGEEAKTLESGYQGSIEMLVTDVVMPDLGGRALADAIRASRASIRVLFVSGYTDDALMRHGVLGADAFLQKPFTPLTLVRKVRSLLDQSL